MKFLFPEGKIHLIALSLASEGDAFIGLCEKEPSIKVAITCSYRIYAARAD